MIKGLFLRNTAIVAVLFVIAPAFSNGSKDTSLTKTGISSGVVQKPSQITWMVHDGLNKENGTAQWTAEFERLTGIKMNLKAVSNNEYETILDLAFASGDVPDVFDLSGSRYSQFIKQGALADLTDLVKKSELWTAIDRSIWNGITVDGKIYGVPKDVPGGTVTYVRQDWLDRLGMKAPATYAEFITMLRAFKEKIPECKVPFTAPGLYEAQYLREFYQNAMPDFTKNDKGIWIDGMADDSMAAALKRMQEAYKEKLIDVEVITNKTSSCRDEWFSGSVGVFTYWAGKWGQTLSERLTANVPTAKVIPIDAIKETHYICVAPSALCIPSSRKPEQVAAIFKYFMEYMDDGAQGQVLFYNGVENLMWKQVGDHIEPLPSLSNPKEKLMKAFFDPATPVRKMKLSDKKINYSGIFVQSLAIQNKDIRQLPVQPVSKKYVKISSDLIMLRKEILSKVVIGAMSVEDGMAKYRKESAELGVPEVLAEYNQK